MNKVTKDIITRALKTFVQAFIASLAVATQTDTNNYKAIVIAAVAAGVSAVWNLLLTLKKV